MTNLNSIRIHIFLDVDDNSNRFDAKKRFKDDTIEGIFGPIGVEYNLKSKKGISG